MCVEDVCRQTNVQQQLLKILRHLFYRWLNSLVARA